MIRSRRTDLAEERQGAKGINITGIDYKTVTKGSFTVSYLDVTSPEGEAIIGKPRGRYVTLSHPFLYRLSQPDFIYGTAIAAAELRRLAEGHIRRPTGKKLSVLAVGLGNNQVHFDSIGPNALEQMQEENQTESRIYRFIPRCAAQNGIDTYRLVKGAAEAVKADIVIAIDSILAGSPGRLGRTVQLSECGICPGSGAGGDQGAISFETVGVPVIAMGIPTAADAGTVVGDIFEARGAELKDVEAESMAGLLILPTELELMLHTLPCFAASTVEKAFSNVPLSL